MDLGLPSDFLVVGDLEGDCDGEMLTIFLPLDDLGLLRLLLRLCFDCFGDLDLVLCGFLDAGRPLLSSLCSFLRLDRLRS